MTEEEKFMRAALSEAKKAEQKSEVPVGAVIVMDGKVIARAHNERTTKCDPTAHAEVLALRKAGKKLGHWNLEGCELYVTKEPCVMCAGLMHQARIDRCVYGARDGKAGALGSLYAVNEDTRLNHVFDVTPGVLANECSAIISGFFANKRKK